MAKSLSRRLVVSAINFTEGGPLTALRDCLTAASRTLPQEWEIIALVHSRQYFDVPRVRFIEFPLAKRSWIRRLYYEFWHFDDLSRKLKPDVWFSLHDISPRVAVPRQVVYCHNPSPFYRPRFSDVWWEPKFFLFTLFYRYLYRLNIHANDLVVVQQDWIRQAFERMYQVKHVLVAHPVFSTPVTENLTDCNIKPGVFLYPALPRVFKNFEVLCEAALLLREQLGDVFEVRLTLDGSESRYAAHLKAMYGNAPVIQFVGRQSAQQMSENYQEATAVVFPSRLETWGLPVSEAKSYGKPIIISDLPYARESVGDYDKAVFFDPLDAEELARIMRACLQDNLGFSARSMNQVPAPFAPDWETLMNIVVGDSRNFEGHA